MVTQNVSDLGQADFQKGQFRGCGELGSVSNCVTGKVFIGERTISLKWMPPLGSIMSGTYIVIKKPLIVR